MSVRSPARMVDQPINLLVVVMGAVGLYLVSRVNYLLFHTLAEGFCIIVGSLIYVLATRTYRHSRNDFLLFLGYGYAAVAFFDFLHLLTYHGINIVETEGPNTATQFWITGRYLEALVLAIAPVYLRRKLVLFRSACRTILVAVAVVGLPVLAILHFECFPDCYVQGQGLTLFKILSEYIVVALLLLGLWHLCRNRKRLDQSAFAIIKASLAATIMSELGFTLYNDVYGVMNFAGHALKIISYLLIYEGIVVKGLEAPYDIVYARLESVLKEARQRAQDLERQLSFARQVQARLLPRGNELPGIDVAILYEPLLQVGGDFCSIISAQHAYLSCLEFLGSCEREGCPRFAAGEVGVIIGDVMGKGPAAALLMSELVAAARMIGSSESSPAKVLHHLNALLSRQNSGDIPYLATAVYLVLNLQHRTVKLASAGHEPAIIYRARDGRAFPVDCEGLTLGVDFEFVRYQEKTVTVEAGDKLLLYTDGITSLQNAEGEPFGNSRLLSIVERVGHLSPQEMVDLISLELNRYLGEGDRYDDCLLVILGFKE